MAKQTIDLDGGIRRRERVGTGVVNPGELLELVSDDTVQAHGTAAVNAQKWFALEQSELGRDINDAYAAAEIVKYGAFPGGSRVLAKIALVDVTRGDFLESAGDGTLRALTTAAATAETARASVVAVALETIANSGGSVDVFLECEVV